MSHIVLFVVCLCITGNPLTALGLFFLIDIVISLFN